MYMFTYIPDNHVEYSEGSDYNFYNGDLLGNILMHEITNAFFLK